jgi:phospholipase D1/2
MDDPYMLLADISLDKYSMMIYTTDKQQFTLYSFILVKTKDYREFSWKINKTFFQFATLNKKLKKIPDFENLSQKLVSRRLFKKQSIENQLETLATYLKALLEIQTESAVLSEFLEISTTSFASEEKLKEGYVYKYGSGRFSNQKRCFNFCNKLAGKKKRWLKLLSNGLEYRNTNTSEQIEEVIAFNMDFKIKYGYSDTGFKDGINISTSQHNFLFRAENIQKRDEWVEAISVAYSKTEYKVYMVRYNSSFIVRHKNIAKAYVDGKDYFSDVFEQLNNAKVSVAIADWWLSPDMYLKRPVNLYPNSKIIDLLGALADRGVQIYVLLYKELTFTLSLNSLYTKKALQARNPNIRVLRHPTLGIRGGEFLWSHHSKLICIDNTIAFLGGLDMCYGRWDTQEHGLTDLSGETWPGIDYSNVRIKDFVNVSEWEKDSIKRESVPRMPWHDLGLSVSGVVVKDLWNYFMEIWNHVIKDITGSQNRTYFMPLQDKTIYQRIQGGIKDIIIKNNEDDQIKPTKTLKFKGLVTNIKQDSLHEELNQIQSKFHNDRKNSWLSSATNKKLIRFDFMTIMKKITQSIILNPCYNPLDNAEMKFYETIKKAEEIDEIETTEALKKQANAHHILKNFHKRSSNDFFLEEDGSIECQVVRSAGSWSLGRDVPEDSIHSAYLQLIFDSKHFIYIENQFFISRSAGDPVVNSISEALIKRIEIAIDLQEDFRVIVVLPLLPAFEGSINDPNATVLRVQLHWEYKTISRGKKSIYERLRKKTDAPEKYIKFYSLRKHGVINDTPVTEMIYIHSKVMIVDDCTVIIGSANINDRSMNGDRDSELCIVVNDTQKTFIEINQKKFQVSEFAHSFRMRIFQEHSGCEDKNDLKDPFSPQFYKAWDHTAHKNTRLYKKIFRCYPDDDIENLNMVRKFAEKAKLHKYPKYSKKIIGNIVDFPLDFLSNENLNITVTKKEYLLPETTFT